MEIQLNLRTKQELDRWKTLRETNKKIYYILDNVDLKWGVLYQIYLLVVEISPNRFFFCEKRMLLKSMLFENPTPTNVWKDQDLRLDGFYQNLQKTQKLFWKSPY